MLDVVVVVVVVYKVTVQWPCKLLIKPQILYIKNCKQHYALA